VEVSRAQRRVHIASELAAVAIVAPLALTLAWRDGLPGPLRVAFLAVGLGTLAIDGWLALRWIDGRSNDG
jgi:hypothetical protein